MKTKKQIINQYTVLSLLAIYMVVVLMFIAYLPKINNTDFKFATTGHTEFFHKNGSTGGLGRVVQRGIKSVIENKRKTLVPQTVAFVLAFFLIFGGVILSGSVKNTYNNLTLRTSPHSYLSLRTLRI